MVGERHASEDHIGADAGWLGRPHVSVKTDNYPMPESIELLRGLAAPIISVVGGWLLKDVVLGLYQRRRDEVRKEHLYRLREVYSPLFFWSGVSTFSHDEASRVRCAQEMGRLLQQAAPLIKLEHFLIFVRLFEKLSGQKVASPSPERVAKARDYIYSQIEMLNFALFTNGDDFDPSSEMNVLQPLRRALRLGLNGIIQLAVWMVSAALLYGTVFAIWGNYPAMGFSALLLGCLISGELIRRDRVLTAMRKRMTT